MDYRNIEFSGFWNKKEEKEPPLGIMPKRFHDKYRKEELRQAIYRYLSEGLIIDPEWIEEYNNLTE